MAYWKSKFAKSEANSPFHHVVRSPSTPGSHNWRHEKAGGTFSNDEHGKMKVEEVKKKKNTGESDTEVKKETKKEQTRNPKEKK